MESKVSGVKTKYVKGIAGYYLQARDIALYVWGFQVNFSCVFINFTIFGRHDVKWRSCISILRSVDIMTQVYYEGRYFGAQHILEGTNNLSCTAHIKVILRAIWVNPKSWATLPFPNPGGFGRRPNRMLDT